MGEFYNPDKLYKGGSRNNSLINKKMIAEFNLQMQQNSD